LTGRHDLILEHKAASRVGSKALTIVTPTRKDAQIVEVAMPDAADLIKSGKVNVFAANKANLRRLERRLQTQAISWRKAAYSFLSSG
jgi:hypothetical protein